MPKYLITWNCGYGENWEVQEHETQEAANAAAYERWREDAENNADYAARTVTPEIIEDYGLDEEEP
jgi:hypothetical protein